MKRSERLYEELIGELQRLVDTWLGKVDDDNDELVMELIHIATDRRLSEKQDLLEQPITAAAMDIVTMATTRERRAAMRERDRGR
ncbi:MAG TPA: hypothetical protein VJ837_05800 [Candidatus Paceibacterota bacterium]|nr:hypothetical protein [Candidatus Paceibacterota bacterium]